MLVNVVGSAYMVERSSGPTSLPAARFVVWIPVQLLAFALGLMLWRARDVRRWLQRRDAETRALRLRIDEARARVAALRSGKDLMHSALDRLTQARDPQEFDELTLTSAEMVRSLLALAKDGQHSADVEAELVKRYVTLFAPI